MRFLPILAAASGLVAGSFAVAQAVAQGATPALRLSLSIEAQPLRTALRAFESQTGLQVSYREEDVDTAGVMAPKVVGELEAEVALKLLLSGTGLKFEFINPRLVRVSSAAESASESTPVEKGAPLTMAGEERHRIRLAQAEDASEPSKTGLHRGEDAENRRVGGGMPEVLVAGSRALNVDIPRSRDDVQPYVIFDRAQIEASGAATIEDLLRTRLTMNTAASTNSQLGGALGSVSQINLRGLGPNQTLILIDGRRAVNNILQSTVGQPDLNGIPLAAVERIEVLPTTASGIYGGSATGGVVNVILRRDYIGQEFKVTYDNSFRSDAAHGKIDFAGGFTLEGGTTSVLVTASFSDREVLATSDRNFVERGRAEILANNPAFFMNPTANPVLGATPNIRSNTTVNGVLQNLTLDNGQSLDSPFTFIPEGYSGTDTDGGLALLTNAGNYNFDLPSSAQTGGGGKRSLLVGTTTKSILATVRRDFGATLHVFAEGSASNKSGEFVTSNIFSSSYTIPASAPNNPFREAIRVTVPISAGDSVESTENRDRRLVAGATLRLRRDWSAAFDYTWNRFESRFSSLPSLSGAEGAQISNGSLDVLRDLNAFPVDFSSFITPGAENQPFVSTSKDAVLRVAGPVFALPGGFSTFSGLVEYRDEFFDESSFTNAAGATTMFPSRSQTVKSVYLETRWPFVSAKNAMRGISSLELQIAGRWDDYSVNGATNSISASQAASITRVTNNQTSTNPTVGLLYKPAKDVMFRVSYGTGFLPPAVNQLVPTQVTQNGGALGLRDPRRGSEPLGVITRSTGGNPFLTPEESKTKSLGVVLTPRLLPGFRISVDWTEIRKTDNINAFPGGLQAVIDSEALFPERVTRAPADPNDPFGVGPIRVIDASLINIARTKVEAYDVQLDYSLTTRRLGGFFLYALATWQTHFKTQLTPTEPVIENVGVSSSNPLKLKANGGIDWHLGNWTVGWATTYYDSYLVSRTASAILNQGNGGVVPSQIYHDLNASFRPSVTSGLFADTEIRAGIRNIFGARPPFDASDTIRYYSPYGDVRLATYHLSLRKMF
jgi:iron complex outermembrane receptor protein